MKKLFVVTFITAIIFGTLTLPVLAETDKIDGDRLERGAKNVALGWTEIPNSIVNVTKDTNNPFLGITVGLIKGTLNTFARTLSGVVDVVTSPIPQKGKEEKLKPEMVEVAAAADTADTK